MCSMQFFLIFYRNSNCDENYFGVRKTYEAIFSLVWTPSKERCQILYSGHLFELECMPSSWHPMQDSAPTYSFSNGIRYLEREPLSNELAVRDCKLDQEFSIVACKVAAIILMFILYFQGYH